MTTQSRPRPNSKKRPSNRFNRIKICQPCHERKGRHLSSIFTYKDAKVLQKYVSDRGKIEPRRKTGTCSKCQTYLTREIKKAREIALLPYAAEHVLFNPIERERRSTNRNYSNRY
jgi:small subunit ribosomal protein S18